MSDQQIAVREHTASTPTVFSTTQAFEEARNIARELQNSNTVPEAYRGEKGIGNVLLALDMSRRMGIGVFAVMQSVNMIHGRPSIAANFLIGVVNSCGKYTPLRYKFTGEPGSDARGCYCVASDKATGEELVGTPVTIKMAKAEGWYGKTGSKWPNMPDQMLMYRAASFWTRVYCPEFSLGMQTIEEMQDIGPASAPSAPPTPVNVTPTTPTPVVPVVEATVVETPQQKLHRLFRERSISWSAVKGFIIGRNYLTEGQTIRDLSDDHATLLCGMIDVLAEEFGKEGGGK